MNFACKKTNNKYNNIKIIEIMLKIKIIIKINKNNYILIKI